MERILEFEKFRNIGFDKKEKLVLNNSLEKGKMGNLVIIVGANNSGKSNVLDALLEFAERSLSEQDVTTLSYKDEDRLPSLTLSTKDGDNIYSYKLTYDNKNDKVTIPKEEYTTEQICEEDIKILTSIREAVKEYGITVDYRIDENLKILQTRKTRTEIEIVDENLHKILKSIEEKAQLNRSHFRYVWDYIRRNCINTRHFIDSQKKDLDMLNQKYLDKYGMSFMPKISKYNEIQLSDKNLSTSISRIKDNKFFNAVFSAINFEVDELLNAYSLFNKLSNKGILNKLENELNKKLKSVAVDFNNLYVLQQDTYKFKIDLESDAIYFTMFKNEQDIVLDYQSTGFKWFFNLYFMFLCSKTLKAGDIVIMDEPATNLHVKGQQELRIFLKEFALKNDITIVLATHSPFLLDMDYLDELRIVSTDGNYARIYNDFSTVDLDEPDSLKPIKEALTISNNVLYDPDKKVVFVEGITDYNYMVAFKNKLKRENIIFLPIQGVGKFGSDEFKKKQKEISKRLIKIKKHSPILMVDGDRAGQAMKTTNKDSELCVFALTDIKQEYKTVENLFGASDLKKLGIKMENGKYVKHSSKSSLFKTFDINNIKLSSETEENFKCVFDYIENM